MSKNYIRTYVCMYVYTYAGYSLYNNCAHTYIHRYVFTYIFMCIYTNCNSVQYTHILYIIHTTTRYTQIQYQWSPPVERSHR